MEFRTRTLSAAAGSGALILALVSACSSANTDDSIAGPAPAATAKPGSTQSTAGATTPTQSTTGSSGAKCEELGNLTGTALQAVLATSEVRSLSLPLANRPVPSKVSIIAVGTAADLEGKTVALGAGDNANYDTCTHCFTIVVNCTTDCTTGTWFFASAGNATFTAVAEKSNEAFDGIMTDVTLEEVRVDFDTAHTTPVPNGACFHVQQLTFDSVAKGTTTTTTDDAGTTSNDGGATTDAGGGGTTDSGGGGTGNGGGGGGGGGGGADALRTKLFH